MKPAAIIAVLVIAASIASAAFLAFDGARTKGAYYDEPKHLATGYTLLTKGVFVGNDNTPLVAVYALPLLFWNLQPTILPDVWQPGVLFSRGAELLAANGVMDTLFGPRCLATLLLVLLLLLVAVEAWRAGGPVGAAIAVPMLAFDPLFLAHGGLVSADLPVCTMAVLAVVAYRRFLVRCDVRASGLLLASLALVLLAKLSGVFVVAVLGVDALLRLRSRGGGRRLAVFLAACIGAAVLVMLCYPGDPTAYLRALERVSHYADRHHTQYFAGALGEGSSWFYPAVFLFKTKPVTLFLAAATLILLPILLRRKESTPDRITLLMVAVFLVMPVLSGYQQGIRFLMPAFPFLAIAAASLGRLVSSTRLAMSLVATLLLVHAGGTILGHPHHLAYFNSLAGGPERGNRWFVDSNSDWGQDVTTLRDYVEREHVDRLYYVWYSPVPVSLYDLEFEDLLEPAGITAPEAGQRALLAIHDTLFRSLSAAGVPPEYEGEALRSLMLELQDVPPEAHIGHTIHAWWLTEELVERLR